MARRRITGWDSKKRIIFDVDGPGGRGRGWGGREL